MVGSSHCGAMGMAASWELLRHRFDARHSGLGIWCGHSCGLGHSYDLRLLAWELHMPWGGQKCVYVCIHIHTHTYIHI